MMTVVSERMTAVWPRTLSTHTAQVMTAVSLLPGPMGIALAVYGTWNRTRYLPQALTVSIALMLVAVVARADFDCSHPASWLSTGGPLPVLGLVAFAYRKEAGADA